MGDQDDKQWLYENSQMPITGGKVSCILIIFSVSIDLVSMSSQHTLKCPIKHTASRKLKPRNFKCGEYKPEIHYFR